MRLLAYGSAFWLTLQYGRDEVAASRLVTAIAVAGAAYALYGLVVQLTDARTILWFDKWAYAEDLTSTFVNQNSYTTYDRLRLLASSALVLRLLSRTSPVGTWRDSLRSFIVELAGHGGAFVVVAVIIFSALVLTGSRAGFISSVVALVVLVAGYGLARGRRGIWILPLLILGIIFGAYLLQISGQTLVHFMSKLSWQNTGRDEIYRILVNAIATSPFLGMGLGSFEGAFQLFRDESIAVTYEKAHSVYLELAFELGVPAAASLTLAVLGMGLLSLSGMWRRRHGRHYPTLGVAATVLVGLHSTVDFSLQMPAVAVTYFAIMGVACAQAFPRERKSSGQRMSARRRERAGA
jgi:O-antigen ligase